MNKEEDLKYINSFSKITLTKACNHFGYNISNIRSGISTEEATHNVRKYIENEIANIYKNESMKYGEKNNSL